MLRRRTPLRANPETTRAWQRRSQSALPVESARRRAGRSERALVRRLVFERDGYRCRLFGQDTPLGRCAGPPTVHHLRKASAGGAYSPANLVLLCAAHNTAVEDHPIEAAALGLVDRGHADGS